MKVNINPRGIIGNLLMLIQIVQRKNETTNNIFGVFLEFVIDILLIDNTSGLKLRITSFVI
jgi:hypothetical protein